MKFKKFNYQKKKINDDFAKKLGAKDLNDLTEKIKDQISSQYTTALKLLQKRNFR